MYFFLIFVPLTAGLNNLRSTPFEIIFTFDDFIRFAYLYKGIPVVMTSQCLYGRTNKNVYAAARKLSIEANVIYGEDMLPETAYVKMLYVLGMTKEFSKVKELMSKNLVGEIFL